jgi:hypothetical protein
MRLPFAYTDYMRARPAKLLPSARSSRHSIPVAPVAAADPVLVLIAEHKAAIAGTDDAEAFPVPCDRARDWAHRLIARDAGHPANEHTQGLVALFADAGEHVEQGYPRPEGLIDDTVDDHPRDWER